MPSFPEDCHFYSTATVSMEMLEQAGVNADYILHQSERDACSALVKKLLKDHTTTTQIPGMSTVFIEASAYIMTKDQMQRLISEARAEGAEDALRWSRSGTGYTGSQGIY